jgi:hypothetical protein
MACNKNLYAPNQDKTKLKLNLSFAKYKNKGSQSEIIKNYG